MTRCIVSWLLAMTACSSALAVEWGTQSFARVNDVVDPGGGQSNFTSELVGGPGSFLAEAMIDDAVTLDSFGNGPWDRGTAHAFAGLAFAANRPPALKAEAILTGNTSNQPGTDAVASANVFASDLFQYIGSQSATLNLTYTLEGEVVEGAIDPNDAFDSSTRIFAQVAVFEEAGYFFSDDFGGLFESGATAKDFDVSTLLIEEDTGGSTATRTTTLTFNVQPGELFYVWQVLEATAFRDARSADAFSTLVGEFDQPELVTSLSVPEPMTLALLLTVAPWLLRRRT